jgi:hypothetical protein
MFLILAWVLLLLPAPWWAPRFVLNQRDTSECVAYAAVAWRALGPAAVPLWRLPSPAWVYGRAQATDGIAGAHAGTTTDAGWAALAQAGWVVSGSEETTQDRATAWAWLRDGPILLDTPWYASMNGPGGVLRVVPSPAYSRHDVLCWGLRDDGAQLACLDSYGAGVHDGGRFYLRAADVDYLLSHTAQFSRATPAQPGPT